jgi:hypothetical protein
MPVPRPLTGSPTGRPIALAGAPGTLIHTTTQGRFERVRLVVSNSDGNPLVLTLVVAGAAGTQQLEHEIGADTMEELPDIVAADGQTVVGFGPQANLIRVTGDTTPF